MMEQVSLTWEAEDTKGNVISEKDNDYAEVEKLLGNLSFFNLYYKTSKVFAIDFNKGTLSDRGKVLHTFSKGINQDTFKFRRRHRVRYSVADKERKPDYISYVVFINGKEIELQPPYNLSDKKTLDSVYQVKVLRDDSGEIDASVLESSK